MEGGWRGPAAGLAALLAVCAVAVGVSGCGDGESSAAGRDAVVTSDPVRAFAPLVELAADEPYRPMSARWFIERSIFGVAEEPPCEDRVIAVGHTLPELQNPVTDWIFPKGLGLGPNYYRNPLDSECEPDLDATFYADQLTRPHDGGRARPAYVPLGAGYVLDLVDADRAGPRTLGDTPVYADRRDEGDGAIRISYWMLFGMSTPPSGDLSRAREGDWRRVDVLLDDHGDDGYEPRAIQLDVEGSEIDPAAIREIPWSAVPLGGGAHPRLLAERASHRLTPARGGCAGCVPWRTWRVLADARKQLWYGFGGAWGERGPTAATTGALGPHGRWPTGYDD